MARTYDKAIVDNIERGVRHIEEDGLDIELRPIPDDDRENVLDPRVYAYAHAKIMGAVKTVAMDDVVQMRGRLNKETHPFAEGEVASSVEIADLGDRGIPVHILRPASAKPGAPVVEYVHGGGWTFGRWEGYENALAYLADIAGAVVVYPEYRLAPETVFPGAVDDCDGVADWIRANAERLGVDGTKLCVMGESAGGSLTNAVVMRQMDKEPVALAVPLYAAVDSRPGIPSYWSYDLYPVIDEQRAEAKNRIDRIKDATGAAEFYTHGNVRQMADPLVSGMCASPVVLSRFPRTVVVASEYDYLRPSNEMFARKLHEAGADVRCIRYLGCDHGWYEAGGTMPQAEDMGRVVAGELAKL
jgi:acetyl esterase